MNWIWTFKAGNNSGAFTYIEYNGSGAYLNRFFSRGTYINYIDAIKLTSVAIQ